MIGILKRVYTLVFIIFISLFLYSCGISKTNGDRTAQGRHPEQAEQTKSGYRVEVKPAGSEAQPEAEKAGKADSGGSKPDVKAAGGDKAAVEAPGAVRAEAAGSDGAGAESGAGRGGGKAAAEAAGPEAAKEAERLYDQGFQVYMSWKLDEAVKLFDRAIRTDPSFYKAYNGKGIVLCFKGNYKEGMALISKALEMKPDFAYANFNMALAYKLQKDFRQALVWFDKTISYDPKDTWSYFGIACIYAEWKDAGKTVEYLKKAIEIDPGVKEAARREKDLDPVRNDPAFKELIK